MKSFLLAFFDYFDLLLKDYNKEGRLYIIEGRHFFPELNVCKKVFVVFNMDITPRKRATVVSLSRTALMSCREISAAVNISKSTVSRILQRNKESGSPEAQRLGKCGRKRKISRYDDKVIVRKSIIDPRKTSFDIQRDLQAAGITVSPQTIRRRLIDAGRRAVRPLKKQLLTEAMRKKRLHWAKKYQHWTVEDWKKVIFSDESHFIVQGFKSRYVRRGIGEPLRRGHIDQAPKHPPKKMFWGYFSFLGTGTLVPVEGMMNSNKYMEILRQKLVPALAERYPAGDGIFQQDLAPCHTSKKCQQFFRTNKMKVLEWPGNSPDINPIENLWGIMKTRLQTMDCSTKTKMIEAIIEFWYRDEKIKKNCETLIESMPKRVQMLKDKKVGHIPY